MDNHAYRTTKAGVIRAALALLCCSMPIMLAGCCSTCSVPPLPIEIICDDIVAHYPFDGDAKDLGPNELDGSVYGATPTEDKFGRMGQALHIENEEHILLDHRLLDGATNFSVSVWLCFDKLNWPNKYQNKRHPGNSIISVSNNETINEFLFAAGICSEWIGGNFKGKRYGWHSFKGYPVEENIWHHYVLLRNGNNAHLYVDGINVSTQRVSAAPLSSSQHGTIIGQEQDSVGGSFEGYQSLTGSIDDLLVFQRALTESEVKSIYTQKK